jgi:hypothetical protein
MFCISQNTVWSQEGGTQNNSGFSSQKKNQNWKYRMQHNKSRKCLLL